MSYIYKVKGLICIDDEMDYEAVHTWRVIGVLGRWVVVLGSKNCMHNWT